MSRTWMSADGRFRVDAKLVEAGEEQVVLATSDGRRLTVPKERLSAADLAYLRQIGDSPETADSAKAEIEAIFAPRQNTELRKLRVLKPQGDDISNLAFSADGRFLLSQNRGGEVIVWDAETGERRSTLERACRGKAAALSSDGRYAVVSDRASDLHVFDARTGELLRTHTFDAPLFHFDVSSDARRLAAVDDAGRLYRFPLLEEGRDVHQLKAADRLLKFAVSPLGDYVVIYGRSRGDCSVVCFGEDGKGVDSSLPGFAGSSSAAITERRSIVGFDQNPFIIAPAIEFDPDLRVESFTKYAQVNSQVTNVERILIDEDEQNFALLNWHLGRIAVGDPEFPHLLVRFPLAMPREGSSSHDFSANGRMCAFSHRDNSVSIWRLPDFVGSPQLRIARTAHAWLAGKQYDKLEGLGEWLREHPGVVPHASGERQYGILVEQLGTSPFSERSLTRHLLEWFEARPRSALARISLAQNHVNNAWLARGGGYADTVSPLAADVMHQNMEAALKEILPLIEGPEPPPAAFFILLSIATAEGWSREKTQPYVDQLLDIDPAYYPANHQLSLKLLPRWGGRRDETEAFARRAAEKVGGADGDGAYALIAAGLHPFFPPQSFLEDTGFDYERIVRGLMHVASREPGNTFPLSEALVFAALKSDTENMRPPFEKIVEAGGFWLSDGGPFHPMHAIAFRMATQRFQPELSDVTPEPGAETNRKAPPPGADPEKAPSP